MKEVKKNFDKLLKIYKEFPLSITISMVGSLFLSIVLGTDLIKEEMLQHIISFIVVLDCGFILLESSYNKNDIKKYLISVFLAIIALLFSIYSVNNNIISNMSTSYILVCLLLSVYKLFERSKKNHEEYITKVFINLFKVSIIGFILSFATIILSIIINTLLFDADTTIIKLWIILFGFYYVPATINSFININDSRHIEFFKSIIKYVFFGILLVEYIIMYIYLGKILIIQSVPSNEVYQIVTVLFIASSFMWIMVDYINKNKINKVLPYLFIPLMILQTYSLKIRISSYGITPARYIGCIFIILEIIYLSIYLLSKKNISKIIFIICAAIIISLNIPGINMYDLSYKNQYNRLRSFNEKDKLSKKDKEIIYSAYLYLDETKEGREYIKKSLTYDNIRIVKGFKEETLTNNYLQFVYSGNYDIKGYSTLKEVEISKYDIYKKQQEVFKNIKVDSYTLDITSEIEDYFNHIDDSKYFDENNIIKIDKKTKLILKSITIYAEKKDIVSYYEIEGYLLRK